MRDAMRDVLSFNLSSGEIDLLIQLGLTVFVIGLAMTIVYCLCYLMFDDDDYF